MRNRPGAIRWGILGVAKISNRLIPAFSKAMNAELRAIASRSLERAKAAAAAAKIPSAYGQYEQLLDDPGIDAVYIPLPNSLHAEWTMKAAERGKHVLCEKPLAANADEALRAVNFCREHQVCLMDGTMWPHHPRTARLRNFLDSGGIGDVRKVNAAFTFQLGSDPDNIRFRADLAGGSAMDVGWYPIYVARWALRAEPARVCATAEWQQGVDLTMNALLEFPGGRTALIDCGFMLPYRAHVELVGTKGTVWIRDMWLPGKRALFHVFRDDAPPDEIAVEGEDQIVHMIENFGRAIREKRETVPSPDESVANMRVIDALLESAREKRPVELDQRS